MYPSLLHSLVPDHITHAHVACPVLCTAASLTSIILLLLMMASWSWSVCACGRISFHRLLTHSLSGVLSRVASGVCCCCKGGVGVASMIGNCTVMLLERRMGVTGTVPSGTDC